MGPGALETTTGKALIRGLRRSIRDMPESDLRVNLIEIRDCIQHALDVDASPAVMSPIPEVTESFSDSDSATAAVSND